MVKRKGDISPRQAADMIGVHPNTVYRWCEMADAGEGSPLAGVVRKDETGHWWIRKEALEHDATKNTTDT